MSTETIYKDYSRSIYNNYVHYARPIKSISKEYLDTGVKTLVTNTSYNYNGLPIEIEKTSSIDNGVAAIMEVTTLTYIPSHYNFEDHYLRNDIVATKTSINGEVVSSNATVWDVINNIPQPTYTYNWLGFGSSTFTNWNESTPPNQWRLQNAIIKRDTKGNILESEDFVGDYEAAIYDDIQRNPVASARYARYAQIAATSFEPGQAGKWTYSISNVYDLEAYTGAHALSNGTASISGLPAGTYTLYYWYKNGACSISATGGTVIAEIDFMANKEWTLRKATIEMTGTGNVVLNTSGLIDEVRIYPKEAYVTTHVFDEKERKVAETGPNMRTTTFYYDDLDRQLYVADHEDNVVKYYEYGFKNLTE